MQATADNWPHALRMRWRNLSDGQSTAAWMSLSIVLTLFIGAFDYLTGTQISLSAFYLIPVSIAAWFVSVPFALFISVACVGVWIGGNILSGDDEFATPFLIFWNGGVQLASDVVVVIAVASRHTLQRELEDRVRERASALTREIAERERLQRELLEVSEHEQKRIGQDLHDGLCQHLAGTAMAGQVLREKLAVQNRPEAADAQKIVELIQEGVMLSRQSAKGLHPVEFDEGGLMLALEEFANTTRKLFRISCRFECDSPVLVRDEVRAHHMYRIAQEAVRNAINHGKAGSVVIRLETLDEGQELRIEDNGTGMPAVRSTDGMGLRIMEHRARALGGTLVVEPRPGGGPIVSCRLPFASETEGHK